MRQLLQSKAVNALIVMKLRSVTLAAKFALTLFIAKFIGFEALGQYGLITGLTIVLPIILGLSLAYTLSRKAVTQSLEEIIPPIRYYALYLLLLYGCLTPLILGAGVVAGKPLYFVTVFAIIVLNHVNQDIYNLLLNLSRPFVANLLLFIRGAFWIFIYIGAAFLWPALRSLEALLLSWIMGEAFALIGFAVFAKAWPWHTVMEDISLRSWLCAEFRLARTLYFNGIANTLSQYSDRYIITLLLGLELTGVYVLFWSISSALSNLVRTGVIQFSKPKLVRAYAENSPEYKLIFEKCLKNTVVVSSLMAIGAAGFMYLALPYLDKPLALAWEPVLWLILGGFILAMASEVVGLIFYSQHKDTVTLKVSCFMLTASVAFNMALVPIIGLWGAGTAMILVMCGALSIQWFYGKKLLATTQ